jgi:hypothetical protein
VVALFTVPISTSFSDVLEASAGTNGVATLSPPTASHVSGTFTSTDGSSVTFEITDSNGNVVYSADANYGPFSFTASSPPYTLEVTTIFLSHTVDVTGHYTAPIL